MSDTTSEPRPDRIILYRETNTGDWRWTRRAAGNNEIVSASTQGYASEVSARENIERTQKQPYTIVVK